MSVQIDSIGIHKSVERVFPPVRLRDYLTGAVPEVDVAVVSDDELDRYNAVVTLAYTDAFLGADLEWIHSIQSGVDRFPFDALDDHGITLTNSSGIHGSAVGETVMGYMLNFVRLLTRYRWSQRDREWDRPSWHEPSTLDGETVCVVGLGTLGTGVATRASALGMQVVGVKRTPEPVDYVDSVYPPAELIEAISGATFVVLAMPLTDETEGMMGTAELKAMPESGYLINVARGAVVDQDALISALNDETIAGAALDVFAEEPLPDDSPLWGMKNVIVTPHTAAHTRDYYRNVGDIVIDNLGRYDGEPLRNRVV